MMAAHTPKGELHWVPVDPQDRALVQMAEGSIFSETTFPSGWVSPKAEVIAKDGCLWYITPPFEDDLSGSETVIAIVVGAAIGTVGLLWYFFFA